MRKRRNWLMALLLVLSLASEAFCIDPFKVNENGFGPKIKGLQLGQKMSLLDIVVWRIQFKGLPFILKLQDLEGNYISIEFLGKEMELADFKIRTATGGFQDLKSQIWELDDLLSKLEEFWPLKVDTLDLGRNRLYILIFERTSWPFPEIP